MRREALLGACLALWRAHARALALPAGSTAGGAELAQLLATCLSFVFKASLTAAQPRAREGGGDDDDDDGGDDDPAWPVCAQLWAEVLSAVCAARRAADTPAAAVLRAALPLLCLLYTSPSPRD